MQVFLRLVVCTTLVVGAIVFTLTVHSPSIQAAVGSEDQAGAAALMPIGKPVKINDLNESPKVTKISRGQTRREGFWP